MSTDIESRHAVILDASEVYFGEVIGDIETIEMNVPEGGSYSLLPEGTSPMISALLFPHEPGIITQPEYEAEEEQPE